MLTSSGQAQLNAVKSQLELKEEEAISLAALAESRPGRRFCTQDSRARAPARERRRCGGVAELVGRISQLEKRSSSRGPSPPSRWSRSRLPSSVYEFSRLTAAAPNGAVSYQECGARCRA